MHVKRVLYARATQLLNNYNIELEFPGALFAGSYSRGDSTVGDVDVIAPIENVKTTKIGKKLPHVSIYEFKIEELKVSVYCVEEKYIPSGLLLLRGPRARTDEIRRVAEENGYYMTHMGLLPKKKRITRPYQDIECWKSDEKILFDSEEKYLHFLFGVSFKNSRNIMSI